MRGIRRALGISVCGLVLAASAVRADWPGWRGPAGDGSTSGNGVFDRGPFGLETAWTRPIGTGYSGISLANGRVVTMAAEDGSDWVLALDGRTGTELWRVPFGSSYAGHDGSEDGPSSTPAIDRGVVFALGPKGLLLALGLEDGTRVWSRDLVADFGAREPRFGFATTPIVVDDLVYVEAGGTEGRLVVALDRRTGATVWAGGGDDPVGYHSPAVIDVDGARQIAIATTRSVSGFEPLTGRVLWRHEWGQEGRDGSTAKLVPLGAGALVIHDQPESIRIDVRRKDGGFEARETWRDDNLKARLSSPVHRDGHLYGFDGRFLTCVDAATGQEVWKSRPPGGTGLVAVDRHLVILGAEGTLVVAHAVPDGYREEARATVLGQTGVTYPAFASGTVFVRNGKEIAAVRVTAAAAVAASGRPTPDPASATRFQAFVRSVEAATDKRLLVDAFFAEPRSYPIVEDGFVHFVYRGAARDVGITGSMTRFREELTLAHVPGTDLHYRSFPVDPGLRWEYQLNVDFDTIGPDPLNPRRVPTEWYGDQSEVLFPGYDDATHRKPHTGPNPGGRVETIRFASTILGNERDVHVYLAPGYDAAGPPLPLVVVHAGDDWLTMGHLPNTLDHLIGGPIGPAVVALVAKHPDGRWGELGGERTADYVRAIADELVPLLEERFRVRRDARSRSTFGTREAGIAAIWSGLARPDRFGTVAAQSIELTPTLVAEIDRARDPGASARASFYVQWNRRELMGYTRPYDLARDGRELVERLERAGYEVTAQEAPDASGWGGWSARVAPVLAWLAPPSLNQPGTP